VSDADPHIHVEVSLHTRAATRNLLASTFGLAADLPTSVGTGCGIRVAVAMTSARPGRVTCLACREYAHREHLRMAEEIQRFSELGTAVDVDAAAGVAAHYRALARQFAGRPGDAG
jgi:hypothetical protein